MKRLLALLVAGTLAFILLGMAQEWRVFASAWRPRAPSTPALSASEKDAAIETLRLFLTLTRHVHGSGGDPRFVERLPASERLASEIAEEAAYLSRNGRRQVMELLALEILGVRSIGADSVELHVRERWDMAYRDEGNRRLSDSPGQVVSETLYLVSERDSRWTVDDWKPSDAALELR